MIPFQSRSIPIKSNDEIEQMRKSGKSVSIVLKEIGDAVRVGVTTKELDIVSRRAIKRVNGQPSFLNYEIPGHTPYPATICASINEEIIHGIPGKRKLRDGDIISIDVGLKLDGYHGDNAFTFPVGKISAKTQRLLDVTKASLYKGIDEAKPGNRVGDISYAIQSYVESHGYSPVRDFVGHGIGSDMHEEPQVPDYGQPNRGPRLKPGMVLAIEPMINEGVWEARVLDNGWTAVTADGKLSAHFEHTVAILSDGPEILTWNEELWL